MTFLTYVRNDSYNLTGSLSIKNLIRYETVLMVKRFIGFYNINQQVLKIL